MLSDNVDHGYAWVIVLASFLAHTLQFGIVWTVGIFYAVFLQVFDASATATSVVSSLNTATLYFTGPISRILCDRYGARAMAMGGGLIGSLGLVLSMFATNIYHLQVTFGVIIGFGFGVAYIPTISIVCVYFKKKRTIALGLAVSGIGMGTIVFPHVINWLIDMFGWRGGLLITGGICMNICVCGALMRPQNHPLNKTRQYKHPKDMENHEKECEIDSENHSNCNIKKKTEKDKVRILNCHIFTNTSYMLLCMNNFFFCFGLSIIYVHLAAYAHSLGFTASQGATLFSALGVANFVGRIAFGVFAHAPCVSSVSLYTMAFFLTGAVTELTAYFTTYAVLVGYAVIFGFLTASLGTLLPVLLEDILGMEMRDSGYGYLLIFEGAGTVLGAPVAALVYDHTRIYQTSLYLGGAAIMASALLMTYPWFCAGAPRKHTTQEIVAVEVSSSIPEKEALRDTSESAC